MGNPLALLGLLAVAVPVLIHLLGRHQSKIERFPTLRFIGVSRLNPTSRRRISDWPLLLVRIAIVALAALALGQPLFRARPETSSDVSRVVIVDTSASVARSPAIRATIDSLSTGVTAARVETSAPGSALGGAVAWLSTRRGRVEIAIVSDFQRSSIDTAVISALPPEIGLRLVRVPQATTPVARQPAASIATFAGPADVTGADAAWRAIGLERPTDTTGRVAIIYRGAADASALAARAVPVDSMWMARIVAAVDGDETLRAASGGRIPRSARDGSRLVFFLDDDAGSLPSAALNRALVQALSADPPGSERDTGFWTDRELARWQRDATPNAAPGTESSDARWVWLACLVLIALETWMRSRNRAQSEVVPVPAVDKAA